MLIVPTQVIESGPGIDLSNEPGGLSVKMSDPVEDFDYARNAVTLIFDLAGVEHVRLGFEALEFGDEPHAPPPGPFADDVDFDGVAVSVDGVNWYEIQDLRHLRSDKFTEYDLDLDAAVAALGLAYTEEFRIRFCQYDNNPSPMDGFSIHAIELDADLRPAFLHLPMDDNAATPTVLDASEGHHDQTFVDPGGDPNTNAHTAAGQLGTSLSFDGIDDFITLTEASHRPLLEANQDFCIALWWKTNAPDPAQTLHVLSNYVADTSCILCHTFDGDLSLGVRFYEGETRLFGKKWVGGVDEVWHHYVLTRRRTVISICRDGALAVSNDHPENVASLAPIGKNLTIGSNAVGSQASPGFVDDFRIYDRALLALEIQTLAAGP